MNTLLQLEESNKTRVPEHFQHLVENVLKERSRLLKEDKRILETFSLENDYILAVLVTVAVECGFRLESSNSANFDIRESKAIEYKPKWRDFSRCLYTVDFQLPELKNVRCVLLLVPILGNAALVNLLSLQRASVVRSSVMALIPGQWLFPFRASLPERFNNLPALARRFRNFFLKEKDITLNSVNVPNPSLLGLPEELKMLVFKLISAKDFVQLTATCKLMRSYQKNESVWRHYLKKDFNVQAEDPFDIYVCRYCTSKVVAPGYPDFGDEFFPMMLSRTTSVTTFDIVL